MDEADNWHGIADQTYVYISTNAGLLLLKCIAEEEEKKTTKMNLHCVYGRGKR